MADFSTIIQEINDDINTNGGGAITGAKLNEVLRDIVSAVNDEKQDTLTIDATPTEDSTNPVQSGGVYDELTDKQDTISDLTAIRSGAAAGSTAYQKPSGGIPKSDLASDVQTSLGKADTAVQQVTVGTTTTGNAGTNASVTNSGTATAPVLNFTIPRGADGQNGQNGADAVNPFKGWYDNSSNLPANPVVGDYAYVKGSNQSDPVAIYECTTTGTWSDSGRTFNPANNQEFASGEDLNTVHIVNDLHTGGVHDVLSAEQGVVINEELYDQDIVVLSGDDEEGKVLNANGAVTSIGSVNYHLVKYDVSLLSGKTLKITANSNWGNCLWAFYNDSTLVQKGEVSANTSAETTLNDYDVIVPNTATILYLSYNLSWDTAVAYYYTEKVSRISALEAEISPIKEIVDLIPTDDMMINYISEVINKYYISNTGTVTSTSSVTYIVSDYIPVNAGEVLYLTASSNYGNALWAFYKSDKSVFSVGQTSASGGTVTEVNKTQVTVPIGAAYVVVARNTNSSLELGVFREEKIIKKAYTGKKWVVVGDSLTEENSATTKHYFDYVAEKTGISIVNMGVGGTGYMRGKDTSKAFYQRISSIDQSADVVTIFGSFNDLNYPVLGFNSMEEALGNYDDDTDATISGCMNLTIENLQTAIPLVRLGIVAPCPWASTRPFQSYALMYVDRLKKIAEYHSIPFLDLWRGSNLRPWDADFRALAYTKDLGQDNNPSGTHPDETGHAILAPKFEAFLGELLLS